MDLCRNTEIHIAVKCQFLLERFSLLTEDTQPKEHSLTVTCEPCPGVGVVEFCCVFLSFVESLTHGQQEVV